MTLGSVIYDLAGVTLKSVPVISDVIGATGILTKNISEWITIDGSFTFSGISDAVGYKNVGTARQTNDVFSAGGGTTIVYDYTGKKLTEFTGSHSIDKYAYNTSASSIMRIIIDDLKTGFLETWVNGSAYVGMTLPNLTKAYFYGWKLTTADLDVANCVWTGIKSGVTKSGATGYAFVVANMDAGFTPYKMVYQLATPATSQLSQYLTFSKLLKQSSYGVDGLTK